MARSKSKCTKAGHFQSPKTHNCVTCKAFTKKELQQYSRLLGLPATKATTRKEMCQNILKSTNRSTTGKLINRVKSRDKRSRDAKRRYDEKKARGEAVFGGGRPAQKSVQEWATTSVSPFYGTAQTQRLAEAGLIPPAPVPPSDAPPALASLFGNVPQAPPSPFSLSSAETPSLFSSGEVDFIELDEDYLDEDDMPDLYDYDVDYLVDNPKKARDWRQALRELSLSQQSSSSVPGLKSTIPDAPPSPSAGWTASLSSGSSYDSDAQAIYDFIQAYANRKGADGTKYYKKPKDLAGAMTRDLNQTSNLTTDYAKWKQAPWDHDFRNIDTEGSSKDFIANFKDNKKFGTGFLRQSGVKRSDYL